MICVQALEASPLLSRCTVSLHTGFTSPDQGWSCGRSKALWRQQTQCATDLLYFGIWVIGEEERQGEPGQVILREEALPGGGYRSSQVLPTLGDFSRAPG